MSKMRIKVLSLNIRIDVPVDGEHQWAYRLPTILAYIRDQKPDVCLFQEVNESMFLQLQEGLKDYKTDYVGRDSNRKGEACPIFFNRDLFELKKSDTIWLSHTPRTPGSMDQEEGFPRIAQYALLKTKNDFFLQVINTHLAYRSTRNQDLNLKVLFDFVLHLDQSHPVIIGGDFNMPKSKIVNYKPRDYEFSGRDNPLFTYHEFQGGLGLRQIDHLMTHRLKEENFIIDQAPYLGRHLSDHYPIIGEYIYG
jgi:endonuclease/exonuclease/phosphatase family metal-dependent hydrolase